MSRQGPAVVLFDTSSVEKGTAANPVKVDPTGTTTQPVSAATLPLPTGAAADATLTGGTQKAILRGGAKGTTTAADITSTAINANQQAADVNVAAGTLTANIGTTNGLALDSTLTSGSQKTQIQGTVTTAPPSSSTATVAQVAASVTNAILLASNAARKFAIFMNDSTAVLFLKFGATASSSSYTAKLLPGSSYELPVLYTGEIDGIWSAANGNCYVTECT